MENTETTIVENNAEVISQPIKKKSNKKVVIFTTVIAIVVLGIVAAVIAIVAGNSNSLWKKPFDEESYQYGYSVTPEEFIEKVNEIDLGCEYEYFTTTPSENNPDMDMYGYMLKNIRGNFAYGFLDYYQDNTIRQTSVMIPSSSATFKSACGNMGEIAAQILYAYDAFGKNASEDDVIDASDIFEIAFGESTPDGLNMFKYNDFLLTIKAEFSFETNAVSVNTMLFVAKTDEGYIEELEQDGATIIDLTSEN